MLHKKIEITNFHSRSNFELDSDDSLVVITGKNGTGKTNILEAISLLAKSNGIKKAKTSEMQNRLSNEDWAVYYDFFNGAYLNCASIPDMGMRFRSPSKRPDSLWGPFDFLFDGY